ncbi:tRNA (guanine(10)-N(2))-dimethyltransferase [archaeon]|nr:tRNA (guanine(10)-N(2))-dimethyltransferase [archaeon]
MEFIELTEGAARLYVPRAEVPTRRLPAFYNPAMRVNRDIAVAIARVHGQRRPLLVCEPLCGAGARAVRYALEAGARVVAADVNPQAVEIARHNAQLNKVSNRVYVEHSDARLLLHRYAFRNERFSIVDVDPFGSPVPFLDAAVCATLAEGILAATATDTAALFGTYPTKCVKKYAAKSIRAPFSKEIGLRILLAAVAWAACRHDCGIEPLCAYTERHYARVYVRILPRPGAVTRTSKNIGRLMLCSSCGYFSPLRGIIGPQPSTCPHCGKALSVAGPLWIGPYGDPRFCAEAVKQAPSAEAVKLLKSVLEEAATPLGGYHTHHLAAKLGKPPPSSRQVVKLLRERGFIATVAHYDPRVVKTDASFEEVVALLSSL